MRQKNNEVKMAFKAAEEKWLHLCYVFLTFLVLKGKGSERRGAGRKKEKRGKEGGEKVQFFSRN